MISGVEYLADPCGTISYREPDDADKTKSLCRTREPDRLKPKKKKKKKKKKPE
jgi:hypothetical protein